MPLPDSQRIILIFHELRNIYLELLQIDIQQKRYSLPEAVQL